MAEPTRVALALGSGGARGYAHIGVIEVLAERGAEIVSIAGSSMGAVVGGLHAAGQLDPYSAWVQNLRQRDIVRLLDVSLSAPGAIRAEKVLARVRELLGGVLIEDLPVPFTAVATDLFARKEVWFQKGPLDAAIRASIAIPGVITPVMLNGRLLADGGVTNPVPLAPTSSARADVTIAVSLGGESRNPPSGSPVEESAEPRPIEEWADRFRAGASQLLDREVVRSLLGRFGASPGPVPVEEMAPLDGVGPLHASDADTETGVDAGVDGFGALPAGLGKFDMMYQSLDAMQSVLTRYRLAGYPPDVLVSIPRDACRSLDFHRAPEMIELGRAMAEEALDRSGLLPAPAAPEVSPGGWPDDDAVRDRPGSFRDERPAPGSARRRRSRLS
jgi:NTE family protein